LAPDRLIRADEGPVAVLRFNRPRVLNAFSPDMFEDLLGHLEAAAEDDGIRAIVLTGEGRAFSAGIDLKGIADRVLDRGAAGERETIEVIQTITERIVALPKVVIAAVNGAAVGFGAELAVAADVRIAAEGATFSFPEVQRALFATGGSTLLLPLLVGASRATEWMLSGRTISAEEALRSGLVTGLVAGDGLLDEAIGQAQRIADNAPFAVGRLKRLLREAPASSLEHVLRRETEGALECLATDDFEEGIRSFLERRPPRFTGE
jgi:enoyl-CoA hydratase/carnithine racemase